MRTCQKLALFLGRVLVGYLFVLTGVMKIMDWSGTAGYMATKGMPLIPVLLTGAILVELLGGLSVVLGVFTRLGAFALFLFLVPTTIIFHDFWAVTDPMVRMLQSMMFMKNLAMMGGLLLLSVYGAGPWSIDGKCCESCCDKESETVKAG